MPPRKRNTAAAPTETPAADVEAAPLTPDVGDPIDAGDPVDPVPLAPPDESDDTAEAEAVEVDDEPITDAAPLAPPDSPDPEPEIEDDRVTPPPPPPSLGQEPTLDVVLPDGSKPDPDTLFTDPGRRYSYVIVNQRLLEQHYYGHAKTPTRRLRYQVGARVPRGEADRIREALASS
ncbi:hypothetical protein [Nonomuraea glycinis]|uniref:hypothetical protein n=1 Tax=Nonomuraea glycinis TaxID=2047744 RepID=UPI0033AE221B